MGGSGVRSEATVILVSWHVWKGSIYTNVDLSALYISLVGFSK